MDSHAEASIVSEETLTLLAGEDRIGRRQFARVGGKPGASARWPRLQRKVLAVAAFMCALLVACGFQAFHGPHLVTSLGATHGSLMVAMDMGPLAHPITKTFRPDASNTSFSHECRMTSGNRCHIDSLPKGEISAVYPGGATRCIFGSSPPFLFQVISGASDKLVIHFDDGGSCWDALTANLGACKTAVAELGHRGIFDVNSTSNPYAEHTFVVIGYCGGDVHVGDVNRSWMVPGGGQVSQRGYWNSLSAIDWAKANVADKRLKSLIISGSSAGSLGAQVWARKLLSELDYDSAAVIADSFAGVFPAGVQGQVMRGTGLCKNDLIPQHLQPLCVTGTLDVQTIFEDTMRTFPDVVFASIDSKVDSVQIAFYQLIHGTLLNSLSQTLTPQRFSESLDDMTRRYMMQPNWVTYLVNSQHHLFLCEDIMYKTKPGSTLIETTGTVNKALSLIGVPLTGSNVALADWLRDLPVKAGQSASSVCRGVGQQAVATEPSLALGSMFGGMWNTFKTAVKTHMSPLAQRGAQVTGLGYCVPGLDGKTFTRPY